MAEPIENSGLAQELPKTPQEIYKSNLERYNSLSQQIRNLEGNPIRTNERILEIDRNRSAIHRDLESNGLELGKDNTEVFIDILSMEGNLKELGVNAPLVRLPMVEARSKKNSKEVSQYIYDSNHPNFEWKRGYFDYRSEIGGYSRPSAMTRFIAKAEDKLTVSGDPKVAEKWGKDSTFAIVFANWNESWGLQRSTPPFTVRMKRMIQLAKDFKLNIFLADDGMGHNDYTSNYTYGVEVSADQIEKLAQAMRDSPEKYWLTTQELADPYSPELLGHDDAGILLGHARKLFEEARKTKNWNATYNGLRVYNVMIKKPEFSDPNYSSWFRLRDKVSDEPGDLETIDTSIEEARKENPQKAEEMETLKKSMIEALNQ